MTYIPVLDVRHVKILDHENTVQDNLKFSSSQSIISVLTLRSLIDTLAFVVANPLKLESVAKLTLETRTHSLDSGHARFIRTGCDSMNANDPRDAIGEPDPRDLIWGNAKAAIERRLTRLDPDLERYVREFAYGEVYGRSNNPGGLEPKVQEWLAIVMLAALGSPGEIKTHLRGAMNAGASEQELREVILFTIPYLGFPKAINAMQALKEYLLEREAKSG
jgi:4-carboxymuconolactone decarboxylase